MILLLNRHHPLIPFPHFTLAFFVVLLIIVLIITIRLVIEVWSDSDPLIRTLPQEESKQSAL